MSIVRVIVTTGEVSVCAGCQLILTWNEIFCIKVLHRWQRRFRQGFLIIICSRSFQLATTQGCMRLVLHLSAPSFLLLNATSRKFTQVICWGKCRVSVFEIIDLAILHSSSSLFCLKVTLLLFMLFQQHLVEIELDRGVIKQFADFLNFEHL